MEGYKWAETVSQFILKTPNSKAMLSTKHSITSKPSKVLLYFLICRPSKQEFKYFTLALGQNYFPRPKK